MELGRAPCLLWGFGLYTYRICRVCERASLSMEMQNRSATAATESLSLINNVNGRALTPCAHIKLCTNPLLSADSTIQTS